MKKTTAGIDHLLFWDINAPVTRGPAMLATPQTDPINAVIRNPCYHRKHLTQPLIASTYMPPAAPPIEKSSGHQNTVPIENGRSAEAPMSPMAQRACTRALPIRSASAPTTTSSDVSPAKTTDAETNALAVSMP